MHRSTMIALHKILNDQLPIGLHIIDNRLPHLEIPDMITSKRSIIAKAFNNRLVKLLHDWRGRIGKIEPDLSKYALLFQLINFGVIVIVASKSRNKRSLRSSQSRHMLHLGIEHP